MEINPTILTNSQLPVYYLNHYDIALFFTGNTSLSFDLTNIVSCWLDSLGFFKMLDLPPLLLSY